MSNPHDQRIQAEFERAAEGFAERTQGRFDNLGVVEFARVEPGRSVMEVGAGTGNFLSLFAEVAGMMIAADLTPGMLRVARERNPAIETVACNGTSLPFRTGSIDIVASAQMFHHIHKPIPILKEMRRVCAPDGYVLVVDQIAPENIEQAEVMNELEVVRDPSHAASRPLSAFRIMFGAAGLSIVDERVHEDETSFSKWMWPSEFPQERIESTLAYIERHGAETGMGFRRAGDEWVFTRRRAMILGR
jgi:ubiquinone/menaquinone biosynthesis C-methylase UbiE